MWLFTQSDLKTVVYPETAFGIVSALSGGLLTTCANPNLLVVLGRLPQVLLWIWLHLLVEVLANQRLPDSILEDSINKPWRPMPAQRLSLEEARRLLLWITPLVALSTLYLGGTRESMALIIFTWLYNDLGGADENYIVRNLLNACGLMCFSAGATTVAAGYGSYELNEKAYIWLGIMGGVILSTVHTQDMADMEGDAARGRKTIPLVHGEWIARWSIAIAVTAWSLICPAFWQLSLLSYAPSILVGGVLALRILLFRSVTADKMTWKVWCVWSLILYLLPIFKDHSVFIRFWHDLKQV